MDAIIMYWSKTGNTKKVAGAVQEGLKAADVNVTLKRIEQADDVDIYGYDLVCLGFPSYQWRPPKPMDTFLNKKFAQYRSQGRVKVGAPEVPGKKVWSSAPIRVPTRASVRPFQRVFWPDNSLSIWVLQLSPNGTSWANIMDGKKAAPGGDSATSGAAPMKTTCTRSKRTRSGLRGSAETMSIGRGMRCEETPC